MMKPAFSLPILLLSLASLQAAEPLSGTKPLTADGDLAAKMVEGIDKYLMRELADSVLKRKEHWKPDYSSVDAYTKSIEPNRQRLRKILGVVDPRVTPVEMEYVGTAKRPALIAETDAYKVYTVRWPVLEGVDGEGLLLEPKGKALANVIALPDADWTPEMLVGLAPGVPKQSQFARRLAENGCRVIVPVLIDRKDTWSGNPKVGRMTNQPHREFIYRMAYEMGRTTQGSEVQKNLAAIDALNSIRKDLPIGVIGYGEGGRLGLFTAALDDRVKVANISGTLGCQEPLWQGPIDHNAWSYVKEFADDWIETLVAPRFLRVERSQSPSWNGPELTRSGRTGAAPGRLVAKIIEAEDPVFEPVNQTFHMLKLMEAPNWGFLLLAPGKGNLPGADHGLREFEDRMLDRVKAGADGKLPTDFPDGPAPKDLRANFDPAPRQKRQFDQLVAFTQNLLHQSEYRRQETFWAKFDTSSLEKYQKSCEPFRKEFWEEVIGKLPAPTMPANPRTRPIYDEPKWKGYEVMLDVYPDVFAQGILLVPKDLKTGEKRPVVVCQHGLEGRPTDVCNPKEKTKYYNSFGAQLADRGYIVYAPQNPYIGQDKFRVLQRKANPLGLSLFSFIVRQHERTLDWLAELPFVDPERLAFYGLSYGGKTAMRVPALLPRYCLSICAGDFNEWVWKNATIDWRGSYMFSGEYEMPEFNLGHTFNYAEMAALIAPRPFMVERGHDDGVGQDEQVAYEYAKVRRLYDKLGIGDRTAIEFFNGGHEIHGKGTFEFLDKHLKFPK
ncbi:MAG: dienelactone hydrolase family protein [Gemmataceae bacterium]